jgi:hypothetical protein
MAIGFGKEALIVGMKVTGIIEERAVPGTVAIGNLMVVDGGGIEGTGNDLDHPSAKRHQGEFH